MTSRHITARIALALSLALGAAPLFAAREFTIPNELQLRWPLEHAYFTVPAAEAPTGPSTMTIQGQTRPVQVELDTENGKKIARLWTVVTIDNENGKPPASVKATLDSGTAPSDLTVTEQRDYYLIRNGVYEFRLRNYPGTLKQPVPLTELPHWIGGMKTLAQRDWDGRAWFKGSPLVTAARTELIARGPVFCDFRITLEFKQPTGDPVETVSAIPLALGKQTFKWKPNELPSETVAMLTYHYEVMVRFVMNDPWIDVNERFHFPRDPEAGDFGVTQYRVQWGDPKDTPPLAGFDGDGHMNVDTVTWVRWFEYDSFGGNVNQNYVPAKPRPAQKGRPFALLRPRWNQGGGGAQDFVLTSGGIPPTRVDTLLKQVGSKTSDLDKLAKKNEEEANKLDAAAASPNMPKEEREQKLAAKGKLRHDAREAAALLEKAKPIYEQARTKGLPEDEARQLLREAGRTLGLDMPDESAYSPDLPAVGIVAAYASKWVGPYPGTIAAYADDGNRGACRFPLVDGDRSGRHYGQRAYGICVGPRSAFASINSIVRSHTDWTLSAQINKYILTWNRGGDVADVGRLLGAGLFIERRYQDDFLNPTQRANRDLPKLGEARKKAGNKPIGGPWQAALGYIFTDFDHWPGWHNGFDPGNPNFHTDKYMGTVYVAATLPEHPHAGEWLAYGVSNFEEDLKKVLLEPDGVGVECPGYSGYSLGHQLDLARTLNELGMNDRLKTHPMIASSARWHRKLITPYDFRIQRRHEAPHGDTHRWDSGLGVGFGKLAYLYRSIDPLFASEMLGTHRFLEDSGASLKKPTLKEWLGNAALTGPAMDVQKMDWSSQAFDGFGTVMRTGFGTDQETFLSFKAGHARNHYHNDELVFHYYADNTPISLDYNCSYHPRGDHAALHNSMTFGNTETLKHNATGRMIESMEEAGATATVLAFDSNEDRDVVVAERRANSLTMRPVDPEDNEFGRNYPSRETGPIVHRRTLALVKHPPKSALTDYLVVFDKVTSSEPQQINLHLLAREITLDPATSEFSRIPPQETGGEGSVIRENSDLQERPRTLLVHATGQWDKDTFVAFFPTEGPAPRIEERSWHYYDEWMLGPGDDYALRVGESQDAWAKRIAKLPAVPAADWEPKWKNGKDDPAASPWHKLIHDTGGQALIPPPGWNPKKGWMYGEYQKWLRVHTQPGQTVVWVLIPYPRGTEAPTVFAVDGGLKITRGQFSETVLIDADGATVTRN